jgi:AraC-like DNA-binding protein/ligand-binding sensor protein
MMENFIRDIERLTGMKFGIYDLNYYSANSPVFSLSFRRFSHTSPICELMKSCSKGRSKCIAVEDSKTNNACKHPHGHVHTCYAGVTDFVIPITVRQAHTGAAFIGQVVTLPEEKLEELAKKLEATYGRPASEIKKAYRQMAVKTQAEIKQTHNLMAFIKSYIEQYELMQALSREYAIGPETGSPTAAEAVKKEEIPMRVLRDMKGDLDGESSEPIRQALSLIENKYYTNIKHTEIAKVVGMSASHFSRKFRQLTGKTFRRVLLETKMNAALFLIRRYHVTISEAAYLVGYSDEISFRKAFRKLLGHSPREFMRKYPRAFDIARNKYDHEVKD